MSEPKHLNFVEGADYESEMYHATFRCTRQWFESDGHLEMVEMREILPNGKDLGPPFERSARAMQPGMQVAEVRGGVLDHLRCDHKGPDTKQVQTKTWGLICTSCGARLPSDRMIDALIAASLLRLQAEPGFKAEVAAHPATLTDEERGSRNT